jgi:hypothetical protein
LQVIELCPNDFERNASRKWWDCIREVLQGANSEIMILSLAVIERALDYVPNVRSFLDDRFRHLIFRRLEVLDMRVLSGVLDVMSC